MRGELVTPPRLKNSKIPKAINDIVLRALAPDLTHALPARGGPAGRRARRARAGGRGKAARVPPPAHAGDENVAEIQSRLKARETPQPRFCWHCRKPLHARTRPLPVLRRSAVVGEMRACEPPGAP